MKELNTMALELAGRSHHSEGTAISQKMINLAAGDWDAQLTFLEEDSLE